MNQERERYLQNRTRVFEIYGIPKNERGTKYTMHHIVCRHDVGNLVPSTFRINELSNLYPLLVNDHSYITQRIDFLDGKCCNFNKQINKLHKNRNRHHR